MASQKVQALLLSREKSKALKHDKKIDEGGKRPNPTEDKKKLPPSNSRQYEKSKKKGTRREGRKKKKEAGRNGGGEKTLGEVKQEKMKKGNSGENREGVKRNPPPKSEKRKRKRLCWTLEFSLERNKEAFPKKIRKMRKSHRKNFSTKSKSWGVYQQKK